MPQSIIDIEVKDEAFKKFMDLFQKYQSLLAKMPDDWKKVDEATAAVGKTASDSAEYFAAGALAAVAIADAMDHTEATAVRAGSAFGTIAGHAKTIADSILGVTTSLAKWTVFSSGAGLLGLGGGLFGLDRLAGSVSNQRYRAMGLGISTGQQAAFNTDFGNRLVGGDFLSSIQGARADLGSQWAFGSLGINPADVQGKNTADLSVEVIRRVRDLWNRVGPGGHNAQTLNAYGLGALGVDFGTAQRIGTETQAQFNQDISQYNRDVSTMGSGNGTAQDWQNFSKALQRAGSQIESVLVKGLDPLVQSNALPKLTSAIEKALSGLLGSPNLKIWIDDISMGIQNLSTYIGSPKFNSDMQNLASGVGLVSSEIMSVAQKLSWLLPSTTPPSPPPGTFNASNPNLASVYYSGLNPFDPNVHNGYDFRAIAKSANIPSSLLASVAAQESGYRAHPPDQFAKGQNHQGMFQLSTDLQNQLGVNNPYDPNQEANAEAKILKIYLEEFQGNIAAALAANYEGPGAVNSEMRSARQRGGNWLSYANRDVQNYVSQNATRMGFTVKVLNQTGANVAILANAVRQ